MSKVSKFVGQWVKQGYWVTHHRGKSHYVVEQFVSKRGRSALVFLCGSNMWDVDGHMANYAENFVIGKDAKCKHCLRIKERGTRTRG